MENVRHFQTMLPLSSRVCGRWNTSLVAWSPSSLSFSARHTKEDRSTNRIREKPEGKLSALKARQARLLLAAHISQLGAWACSCQVYLKSDYKHSWPEWSKGSRRLTENPRAECQQVMGLCQILIELHPCDTSYCNHTLLLQSPGWD